jgi:hypothetical protein
MYFYSVILRLAHDVAMAEWSKAPDLGSGLNWHGFKSHWQHHSFTCRSSIHFLKTTSFGPTANHHLLRIYLH